MVNEVILVGRLTKDPELRYTQGGDAVASFTLAVGKQYTDQQGNKKEKTAFINCVVWRRAAENLANFKKKGELIAVVGELETRSYDGNDGKKVFVTEVNCSSIQYLPNGSGNSQQQGAPQGNYGGNQHQGNNQSGNYSQNAQRGSQGSQNRNQGQGYQNGNQNTYRGNQGQNGGYNQGAPYQNNGGYNNQPQQDPFMNNGQPINISDDDLPF